MTNRSMLLIGLACLILQVSSVRMEVSDEASPTEVRHGTSLRDASATRAAASGVELLQGAAVSMTGSAEQTAVNGIRWKTIASVPQYKEPDWQKVPCNMPKVCSYVKGLLKKPKDMPVAKVKEDLISGKAGQYNIMQKRLGGGGFGKVLEATTNGKAAQKEAAKIAKGNDTATQQMCLKEFLFQSAVKSDKVVKVHDIFLCDSSYKGGICGKDGNHPVIIMEKVTGGSAKKLDGKRIQPSEFKEIASDLLQGVYATHKANIVHLDIKLENILREEVDAESNAWKLTDFGLAEVCNDAADAQEPKPLGRISGTELYAAPEVWGAKFGKKSDVWSLGVVLYQLLTSYDPFPLSGVKHFLDRPDYVKRNYASVTPETKCMHHLVIYRMLEFDYSQRISLPQAVQEFCSCENDERLRSVDEACLRKINQ